jgi:FAD/FMN-containing dehydrogenase/Fe-S oxidoreductase
MNELPVDFLNELRGVIRAGVRVDAVTRLLYATDASIYQIEPLGVAFPESGDELQAAVQLAAKYRVPVLARGAGSSLAGQAIGKALILDTSRYLTRILELDPEQRTAIVEPGVILATLNAAAGRHGLMFGPDPASAERATVGGSLANNATGAHSICYGMAADHLLSAAMILADGSQANIGPVTLARAGQIARRDGEHPGPESALYRAALRIRAEEGEALQAGWPQVWRRASGYNLNYLLPWSPSRPSCWDEGMPYPPAAEGEVNLAALFAGSEGTLGAFRSLTLRLTPVPRHTLLAVLSYPSIEAACDATPALLEAGPAAIELLPGVMIRLARNVPAYAAQLGFVRGDPQALLLVEFAGDELDPLERQAARLGTEAVIARSPAEQRQVWGVRKAGLGLLGSLPGDLKPQSIVEDLAVPVVRLGEFVREMEVIFHAHGIQGEYYAHASAGCLHIRPWISLKGSEGVRKLREVAQAAVALTLSLGGAVSGEHGDGLARSEWMAQAFGGHIVGLFKEIKQAADPQGIMNPGKILDAQPMDVNLRFGGSYRAQPWTPVMSFTDLAGLDGAIEQCNGAGVCRKDGGVMCPSFQATRDELHSTRGRANLLRAMISGGLPGAETAEQAVHQALALCLACKGCKAECPSGVDMARLKYEFSAHYYQSRRRPWRDYLFGYIDRLAPAGRLVRPLSNALLASRLGQTLGVRWLGLAAERKLPVYEQGSKIRIANDPDGGPAVLYLRDTFSHVFHPSTEQAALATLRRAGLRVKILPVVGAGRALISKGFLEAAKAQAGRVAAAIRRADPPGRAPILGVEPSEIYTLLDEYPRLLPDDETIAGLAGRAWMVDEFMLRPLADGAVPVARLGKPGAGQQVLLHGHCYQKTRPPAPDGYPGGDRATREFLTALGYHVEVIDSGCCGMAGAFGYEAEHYQLSMQVGELSLFPAIRKAGEALICAAGTSCRSQIADGAGRRAYHSLELAVLAELA